MIWKRKESGFGKAWPWFLGALAGAAAALLHLGAGSAGARGDGTLVYEIDLSSPLTPEEVDELARFALEHEGSDVVLRPSAGFEVPSGEARRHRDQRRAAREDAAAAESRAQAFAEGLYVTGAEQRAPCAVTPSRAFSGPGRHLLCEGGPAVAPPRLAFRRVSGRRDLEAALEAFLRDLLAGASGDEEAAGFASSFSDASALRSLDLSSEGHAVVDFNVGIEGQVGGLHTGHASHNMLQQIFRTLFQFRDVGSVEIRLDGSCEAFGELIGGPCQKLDRGLWETMSSENGERVSYFNLAGGT